MIYLIKNGLVVDGTGKSGRRANVAIAGGRIAEIGAVDGSAKKTIDASDLVVAPGFIDPHTHYDAQICWDGATHALVLARRHHGGDGQLRRGHRALPARRRARSRCATW